MLQNSLDGVTVVDFSQIGAGPTCTMLLGDLGARVLKVESPDGDIGRGLGPPWHGADSAVYAAFNRNKESICLDLKHPEGREAVWRMIERADVLVESFRPGVMARLGLDYGQVRLRQPALVYCSVSAYGQDGPYAGRAGVDGILQAASGLMSLVGSEEGGPCKVQSPVVDITTGHLAAVAVLAALHRCRTLGEGIHLDASLFASALALQQSSLTGYLSDGAAPAKLGSAAPYSAPNEAFPTRDGWVMVAAYSPSRWEALCQVLELPGLVAAPGLAGSSERVSNRTAMRAALEPAFRRRTTADWIARLEAVDILCSPVNDYAALMAHPQLQHLGLLVEAQGEQAPLLRMPGFPVRASAAAPRYRYPPARGEHSRAILAWAGYSAQQIDALQEAQAVKLPAAEAGRGAAASEAAQP